MAAGFPTWLDPLDTFDRADENPVVGWTELNSGGTPMKVLSNVLAPSAAGSNSAAFSRDFEAVQEAYVTLSALPTGTSPNAYVWINVTNENTATPSGYALRWWTGGNFDLYKVAAGVFTGLASVASSMSAGDSFGFRHEADGTLRCFKKAGSGPWVELTGLTLIDSTYLNVGKVGVSSDDSGATTRFDNFGGGDGTPSFIAKGAYASGTTTCDVGVPAGIVAGDLLTIVFESTNSTTAAGTPSTPSGWTKTYEESQGAGALAVTTLTIFTKIAAGGETAVTVTGFLNHGGGVMLLHRGAKKYTSQLQVGAGNGATTGNGTLTGLTTTQANATILMAVASTNDAASTTQFSAWTNAGLTTKPPITERHDQTISTGAGGGIGVADGKKVAAGATGNSTVTIATSGMWRAVHVAIYSPLMVEGSLGSLAIPVTPAVAGTCEEVGSVTLAAPVTPAVAGALEQTGTASLATTIGFTVSGIGERFGVASLDTTVSMTVSGSTEKVGVTDVSDEFSRVVSLGTGWGSPERGGGAYSTGGLGGSDYSVDGSVGKMALPTGAGNRAQLTGSRAEVDVKVRVAWDVNAVGGTQGADLMARLVDVSNHYRLQLRHNATSQNVFLSIAKRVAGTPTTLSAIYTQDVAYTPGTFYWMRFQIIGTTLRGKAWLDGSSEPDSWSVSVTDSSFASGGVGVWTITLGGSTAAPTYSYDNLYASSIPFPVGIVVAGTREEVGSLSLGTAVSIVVSGTSEGIGSAALDTTVAITISGRTEKVASLALASPVTITVAGATEKVGAVTLSTVVSITVAGSKEKVGVVNTLDATVVIVVTSTREKVGAVFPTTPVTITVSGSDEKVGAATLATPVAITVSGSKEKVGVVSLDTTVSITVAGSKEKVGSVTLATPVAITVAGSDEEVDTVTLATPVAIVVAGTREKVGVATLATPVTITVSGAAEKIGSVALATPVTISVAGVSEAGYTDGNLGTLAMPVTITVAGSDEKVGAATLASPVTITVSGSDEKVGAATLTTTIAISVAGLRDASAAVSLPIVVSIDASAILERFAVVSLPTVVSIDVAGQVEGTPDDIYGEAVLAFPVSVAVAGTVVSAIFGSVNTLATPVTITVYGRKEKVGAAALATTISIAVSGSVEKVGAVAMNFTVSVNNVAGERDATGRTTIAVAIGVEVDSIRERVASVTLATPVGIEVVAAPDILAEVTLAIVVGIYVVAVPPTPEEIARDLKRSLIIGWSPLVDFIRTNVRGARPGGSRGWGPKRGQGASTGESNPPGATGVPGSEHFHPPGARDDL